jgi:hypothetical protein
VAGIGIVIGSVGTWASASTVGVNLNPGGLDIQPWGLITLILGGVSAVALFIQLNWGRTAFSLRWAVPLCWAVLVAAIASLAIALVRIVIVKSVGEDYEGTALILVGWGLWLIAICSAVLCITAAIVATQIGSASEAQVGTSSGRWAPAWRWAAIVASAVILVIALFNGYKPTRVSIEARIHHGHTNTNRVRGAENDHRSSPGHARSPCRHSRGRDSMRVNVLRRGARHLGYWDRPHVVSVRRSGPVPIPAQRRTQLNRRARCRQPRDSTRLHRDLQRRPGCQMLGRKQRRCIPLLAGVLYLHRRAVARLSSYDPAHHG